MNLILEESFVSVITQDRVIVENFEEPIKNRTDSMFLPFHVRISE